MSNFETFNYPAPKEEFKVLVRCFTYNHREYIEDALNGFAMQQTNFPFVCLVMDDASTDGEQDVIKSWMECECDMSKAEFIDIPTSHVVIVPHKSNLSCTFAFYLLKQNLYGTGDKKMNHVYPWRKMCEYEALCEGDDYWTDPLKLQKQVDFMEGHPDHSLCGTNGIIKYQGYGKKERLFNQIKKSKELFPKDIIGHWLLPTAGILFKKEIYNNYPDWTKKIYSGDLTLLLLSMNQGRIFAFSDVCCVYRRDITNKSSVSINVRKTKSRDFVRNQHILLYSEFNNYTEGKYNVYIQPLIERYADEAKVYKALNKSIIHGFICNPLVFFRIVYRSIKNI